MATIQAVRFVLDCPFLVSFRYAVASTYGRSYRFPTPTVLKGLLENACGFPSDTLPFSNTVMLSLVVMSEDTIPFDSLDKVRIFSGNPYQAVKEQPHNTDFGNLGGGTYVRQYLPPRQKYLVYVVSAHPQYSTEQIKERLRYPFRSLFLGQSDSLVAIEDIRMVELSASSSDRIDSWLTVSEKIVPSDKKQIRGRIPLKFTRVLESNRRQFSREDCLVAVGFSEPVHLVEPISCFRDGDRSIVFIPFRHSQG